MTMPHMNGCRSFTANPTFQAECVCELYVDVWVHSAPFSLCESTGALQPIKCSLQTLHTLFFTRRRTSFQLPTKRAHTLQKTARKKNKSTPLRKSHATNLSKRIHTHSSVYSRAYVSAETHKNQQKHAKPQQRESRFSKRTENLYTRECSPSMYAGACALAEKR